MHSLTLIEFQGDAAKCPFSYFVEVISLVLFVDGREGENLPKKKRKSVDKAVKKIKRLNSIAKTVLQFFNALPNF